MLPKLVHIVICVAVHLEQYYEVFGIIPRTRFNSEKHV